MNNKIKGYASQHDEVQSNMFYKVITKSERMLTKVRSLAEIPEERKYKISFQQRYYKDQKKNKNKCW